MNDCLEGYLCDILGYFWIIDNGFYIDNCSKRYRSGIVELPLFILFIELVAQVFEDVLPIESLRGTIMILFVKQNAFDFYPLARSLQKSYHFRSDSGVFRLPDPQCVIAYSKENRAISTICNFG